MRGQIGSIDAVISLSVLAAMVALWTQMYLDASPVFQIYTYRETLSYGYHMVDKLLFDTAAPWICKTPDGIAIPACIQKGSTVTAAQLDADDLNVYCHLSCTSPGIPLSGCSATYTSGPGAPPRVVIPFRACVGQWNNCTVVECNLEVWHR